MFMKKKIVILGLIISSLAFGEEQKKSKTTKAVSSVVSKIISGGKNVIKGVKDGVDSGRTEGESTDGATLVFNKETLEKNIIVSIASVENEENIWTVNVVLKNDNENFVRLTNLNENKNLQLLNEDGFAVFSSGLNGDVTIPSKALGRVSFKFDLEGIPQKIRIYEVEFDLPKVTAANETDSVDKI